MALRVFKKRREASYHTWQEEVDSETEDGVIELECSVEERARFLLGETDSPDGATCRTYMYGATGDMQILLDCFYLGSYNMTGRSIKGRGCIDEPADTIWKKSQQSSESPGIGRSRSGSFRRKNSLPLPTISLGQYSPMYVRLVAGTEDLKIVNNYTEEVMLSFSYRWISFTGTHPKHARMFCFVAWEPKDKTPYCHAFKCEDATSAKGTALELSNIFKRKCEEMRMGKDSSRLTSSGPAAVDMCSIPTPVLRKAMSVQH